MNGTYHEPRGVNYQFRSVSAYAVSHLQAGFCFCYCFSDRVLRAILFQVSTRPVRPCPPQQAGFGARLSGADAWSHVLRMGR